MVTDDNATSQTGDPVSAKSKKEEILHAYQSLLKEFHQKASNVKVKRETEQTARQELIQKAGEYSVERILEKISVLDSEVRRSLSELGEQLIREARKLNELQEAIRIEKDHLERTKGIKIEIDTLENLIEAQKIQKDEFEQEISAQQEEFEKAISAKRESWKHEQEEYAYELQLNRKKEENAYAEKKTAREQELAEREKKLSGAEQELSDLREKAQRFSGELESAVQKARQETEREIQKDEQTKAELLHEKYDGERRIAALTIDTLRARIATLESEANDLKAQASAATREVKEVAVKVIEGHSRISEAQRTSVGEKRNNEE